MAVLPHKPVAPSPSDDRWKRFLAPAANWKKKDDLFCPVCRISAREHPHISGIFGCVQCNLEGYEQAFVSCLPP